MSEPAPRSLAQVSDEIRDLTTALNNAMSEAAAMHDLRIDVAVDSLDAQGVEFPIPRLRVEQYKRVTP